MSRATRLRISFSVAQAGLTDTEVLRQCGDRFVAGAGQLDGTLTKLGRVRCRYGNILPGDRR
jgi:hypothetical protein